MALCSAGIRVLDRDRPFLEELFHQLVVALGDQFDQLLVRFLGLVFQVSGDFGFLAFAIAAEFVGVSLHLDQVDHAVEILFLADGQFQRNDRAPECAGQRFQNAFGVGALAVHAAGNDQSWRLELFAIVPDPLGNDFNSRHAIHDDDCRVDHRQHHLGFVDEHVEAGGVDDIDFGFAPLDISQARGDRHLAGDFLVVPIGGCGTIVDPAQPRSCA